MLDLPACPVTIVRQASTVEIGGMIYDASGKRLAQCRLRNVSASGAQLELTQETDLPQAFLLALSQDGHVRRHCRKVWQFATVIGVKFDTKGCISGPDRGAHLVLSIVKQPTLRRPLVAAARSRPGVFPLVFAKMRGDGAPTDATIVSVCALLRKRRAFRRSIAAIFACFHVDYRKSDLHGAASSAVGRAFRGCGSAP